MANPTVLALVSTMSIGGTAFDERLPLPVIFTNTGVARSAISVPTLSGVLSAALTSSTTAKPDFVDAFASECGNDVRCLLAERHLLDGASDPHAIVWVSLRATDESTRIVVSLLDPQRLRQAARDTNTTSAALIGAATASVAPPIVIRPTDADAAPIVARAVHRDVVPLLHAVGYRDFDALSIENLPADGWIDVDGQRRRLSASAPRVRGLRPKVRRVVIEPDGFEPASVELAIEMDRTTVLSPEWHRQSTPGHVARQISVVGGGVLAASGIVAAVIAGTQRKTLCLSADGTVPCSPTLAYEASWLLGISSAGAAMSAGAYWVGDDYDWPWVSWLMGAAAFALVTTTIELAR